MYTWSDTMASFFNEVPKMHLQGYNFAPMAKFNYKNGVTLPYERCKHAPLWGWVCTNWTPKVPLALSGGTVMKLVKGAISNFHFLKLTVAFFTLLHSHMFVARAILYKAITANCQKNCFVQRNGFAELQCSGLD